MPQIQLDPFHVMIVSKYFVSIFDYFSLQQVCKKYSTLLFKFHYNPIPLTSTTRKFFPNLETFHVYSPKDFTFPDETFYRRIIWYPTAYLNISNLTTFEYKNITISYKDLFNQPFSLYKIDSIGIGDKSANPTKFCFHSNLVTIHSSVFSNCIALTSVSFPQTLKFIDSNAFENCKLKEIVFPKSLSFLGANAFKNSKELTRVVFETYNITISNYCFFGCQNLKVVTYEGGTITPQMFGLPFSEIPKGFVGYRIFSQCNNLSEVTLPDFITSINDCAFDNCSNLKSICLPECLKVISNNAFSNCKNLQIIKTTKNSSIDDVVLFPSHLNVINTSAFYNCNFRKMEFGNKIKVIGEDAFSLNTNLEELVFNIKREGANK
ncbi:hypothetical protein EIN_298910 [Entamoeba invadens IP1]|uniref:Leucine rich repeat containing protein BspA family protein n=1 Tax=Entamoeba invadens IP1 TaxID=370355 RepID=L7FNP9_ENTIV|nr:hypothetical protein EIN_298910 [Entamoeba invadens IP1]ELP92360.1 hypothetical protein EIN_298910 [Entamoeba invadens IP1]|eukprot:XP_004259131.1 hypothetical protein EIN_298910 [Entamoeba invadens IP1]